MRQISGPPGKKFTWLQLPEAIRALEAGKDIDYEGASGPIDMDKVGNPTAGYYDVYKFQNARLATYGLVSVPPTGKGIQKYPLHYITPKIPGSTPVAAGPSGASGATGPTGASGAAGVKPAKPQKAPTKKKK